MLVLFILHVVSQTHKTGWFQTLPRLNWELLYLLHIDLNLCASLQDDLKTTIRCFIIIQRALNTDAEKIPRLDGSSAHGLDHHAPEPPLIITQIHFSVSHLS